MTAVGMDGGQCDGAISQGGQGCSSEEREWSRCHWRLFSAAAILESERRIFSICSDPTDQSELVTIREPHPCPFADSLRAQKRAVERLILKLYIATFVHMKDAVLVADL